VSSGGLSHLGPHGSARMVDVGEKAEGERRARARAVVRMSPEAARAVAAGDGPKGEIVTPARIAGIAAAKRTDELIPLAHPLPLSFADVSVEILPGEGVVRVEAEARVVGRTGVELEAMTACSVAALTVYDMVKGLDRGVSIERIELVEKTGGRSGTWRREEAER
jgi:cyclic pyranopterin monophosphate synthase